jgi:murein DD-endopeptidase MepM/ murein hydrolase activator NlpD
MIPRRYSIVIADRAGGTVHRFTILVRLTLAVCAALLALPIGWTINARWEAQSAVEHLRLANARLEIENATYRAATNELTTQMTGLQAALDNLTVRSEVDPLIRRSLNRLPGALQQDATGGRALLRSVRDATSTDTFNLLGDLLTNLEHKLQVVRHGVARREALADATPIIWPADGWISARYGYRADPFTGERDFHPAVDISTRNGQPVYATATGRVSSAERSGNYGNLIEIDHGFELATRYGHLSEFAVSEGDTVHRGDVIGFAGATGRATGYHVHYEVWASGRTLDPMRLLAETRPLDAN